MTDMKDKKPASGFNRRAFISGLSLMRGGPAKSFDPH